MRLELIGFRLSLLLALGLLIWGGIGVVGPQRDLRSVTGPVDQAWVLEWLCLRRDDCVAPAQATIDEARTTIEAERVTRRTEYLALRNKSLLTAFAGLAVLAAFYLLRWALTRRIKPLWVS